MTVLALLAVSFGLLFSATPGAAQQAPSGDTVNILEVLPAPDAAALQFLTDLPGFSAQYQFGDDPTNPAQLEATYGNVVSISGGTFTFEGVAIDCTDAAQLCGDGFDGIEAGRAYAGFNMTFEGEIPVNGAPGQFINYSFPHRVDGDEPFTELPQFPGDTWQEMSRVVVAESESDPFTLSTFAWSPDDGFWIDSAAARSTFGVIEGRSLWVWTVIEADPLALNPDRQVIEISYRAPDTRSVAPQRPALQAAAIYWGAAVHIHNGDFGSSGPSTITAAPANPRPPGAGFHLPETIVPIGAPPATGGGTQTEASPTSEATLAPTTAPPATGGGSTPPDVTEGTTDDGAFISLPLILLLVGLLVLLLGGWLILRTGGDDEPDPRDTPPPVITGEEIGYDRYFYQLNLRYWQRWLMLAGVVPKWQRGRPASFSDFDFTDSDEWWCDFQGSAETFVTVVGEFIDAPGKRVTFDVLRVGKTSADELSGKSSRYGMTLKAWAITKNAKLETDWNQLSSNPRTAVNRQHTDHAVMAREINWHLMQHELPAGAPKRMRFKVIQIWTVVTPSVVPEKRWKSFTDNVVKGVLAEVSARGDAAVTAIGGKAGAIVTKSIKDTFDAEKWLTGWFTGKVPTPAVAIWRHLPQGYLPQLETAPKSNEKTKYGTPPEAWARTPGRLLYHHVLKEKKTSWPDPRWTLALRMDSRLHVTETRSKPRGA